MADLERGKKQFLGVVIGATAFLLLLAGAVWMRGAPFNVVTQLGRPIVLVAFALLALNGRRWARTVIGVWLGLLSLATGVTAIAAGFTVPLWSIVLLTATAGLVYGAYLLFTSDDIASFLASRAAASQKPAA